MRASRRDSDRWRQVRESGDRRDVPEQHEKKEREELEETCHANHETGATVLRITRRHERYETDMRGMMSHLMSLCQQVTVHESTARAAPMCEKIEKNKKD